MFVYAYRCYGGNVSAIPSEANLTASNDVILDEQVSFTCGVTDDGNDPELLFHWDTSTSQWPCNVTENTATCDVTDDCNSTISCTMENAAGTSPAEALTTSVLGASL